ncbi:beta-1,3-galactosyltransferase 9-like [Paramacrobiotus metropolitanus]|uniref:beta-1,3-galactosyltransferase 9-like n=1 Tax=Paramacrobiotus metropolitanus TaxID=2943436 RepID=UPI00244629B2|nr:beta-1,3-galactosyltransferase 9-like [Paramacrobiotus metropolitanus]
MSLYATHPGDHTINPSKFRILPSYQSVILDSMYRRRRYRFQSYLQLCILILSGVCSVLFVIFGLAAVKHPAPLRIQNPIDPVTEPLPVRRSRSRSVAQPVAINETFMKVHLLIGNEIAQYFIQKRLPAWHKLKEDKLDFRFVAEVVAKQYSIMPEACEINGKEVFAIVIVVTRPEAFRYRVAIRETWGSLAEIQCGVRLIFMIAKIASSTIQYRIGLESEKFHDIVQSNRFYDNYRAQSLKSIHALQWVAAFCPNSTFTVKIDDDNWLNLPRYLRYLRSQPADDPLVHGGIFRGGVTALRNPEEKNSVPREDYPPDEYPEYLTGMLYALPTRYVGKVVYLANRLNAGLNEDMYINGIVTVAAGLERKDVEGYAWRVEKDKCQKKEMCVHYSSVEDMYRMWNDTCDSYQKLC